MNSSGLQTGAIQIVLFQSVTNDLLHGQFAMQRMRYIRWMFITSGNCYTLVVCACRAYDLEGSGAEPPVLALKGLPSLRMALDLSALTSGSLCVQIECYTQSHTLTD